MNKIIFACLLLVVGLDSPQAKAIPIPALDLAKLTREADQIIVGQVIEVSEVEHTTVDLVGQPMSAIRMRAKLRTDKVIKRISNQPVLYFDFLVFEFGPYHRIRPKQYGMFFLRLKGSWEYVVSDPYYPFIVALPDAVVSEGDAFDKVVAEVAHVLKGKSSSTERHQAIAALKDVQMENATLALRHSASDSDEALRFQAIAALLWRNDISSLESAVANLLNPSSTADPRLLMRMAASVEGIKDPKAIPSLTNLLAARELITRRAAVSALRHTGSASALEPLSTALKDPAREVRYQAVLGLAEITGQFEWGPSTDLFQRDEQHYLDHWNAWAKTR